MESARRRWRPRTAGMVVLVLVALLAVLATGCGRDAGARSLDEDTARSIAAEALLREGDLPEARWRAVPEGEVDAGTDELSPNEIFATPACEPLRQFFEGTGTQVSGPASADASAPLARDGRSFEAADGTFTVHFVRSAVAVYATEAEAAAAGEVAAESLTNDALRDCLGEGLVGFEQEGVEITRVDLSGPGASVNGSMGATLDLEVFALFFTVDLQVHIYTLQRQHVVASLVTLELNSDLLADQQQPLLEAFAQRVTSAHEGK